MPIPESWPTHVRQRARTFLALLKYYRFSRTLSEAAVPRVIDYESKKSACGDDTFRGIAFLSYWIASLYVLSEGWKQLCLHDSAIDPLLTDEHMGTLREYRNTVFHFQANLDDPRVGALAANSDVIEWVIALGTAYENFFRFHDGAIDVERIRAWLFGPERA